MSDPVEQEPSTTQTTTEGKTAWLLTDGKIGMMVQADGVAAALGLKAEHKRVEPTTITAALAPYGPVPKKDRPSSPGSPIAPPFPNFVIATGRQSIPYLRAIRKAATPDTFTIVLQDPKAGTSIADLIWVPEHDKLRGHNVITTLTSPHAFTPQRLSALRAEKPAFLDNLPRPYCTLVVGGPNGVYKYTESDADNLANSARAIAQHVGSLLITPSRRTPDMLKTKLKSALEQTPHFFWDETGDNPYPHMLAHADYMAVTADSVNMCGEACVTGKPVYIFHPEGGSDKFSRFHKALEKRGATRVLEQSLPELPQWTYEPLNSAQEIAQEVQNRWSTRQRHLPYGWPQS